MSKQIVRTPKGGFRMGQALGGDVPLPPYASVVTSPGRDSRGLRKAVKEEIIE